MLYFESISDPSTDMNHNTISCKSFVLYLVKLSVGNGCQQEKSATMHLKKDLNSPFQVSTGLKFPINLPKMFSEKTSDKKRSRNPINYGFLSSNKRYGALRPISFQPSLGVNNQSETYSMFIQRRQSSGFNRSLLITLLAEVHVFFWKTLAWSSLKCYQSFIS